MKNSKAVLYRRNVVNVFSLVALILFAGSGCSTARGKSPNIVFMYTDDQAAWTVGALGNPQAHTPNLDRLFLQGARLMNSFVTTPVCSPSRAGLMASRYGTELGISDFLNHSKDPDLGLDPEIVTWPEVLSEAGYATGMFGKWHLGKLDRYLPTRTGYDVFKGFRVGANISQNPSVEIQGQVNEVEGFTPDILTDYAIEFIRRERSGPFLVNLHFWAPHANTTNRTPDGDRTWLPLSDEDWEPFRNLDPSIPNPAYPELDVPRVKRMMREYLASVASVDRNVGRLLALLDELNLTGNTIVIFTSDHGYNMGHNGIWHKGNAWWILKNNRGMRPNLYDNSLRVPAVVRWPEVIRAGVVVNETLTNLDWYPTILAMADATAPEQQMIRGRNFLPLLKGESLEWNNDLYGEYSLLHQARADLRMWRTREWKLIRDFKNPGKDELYHLAKDPAEMKNLIDVTDPDVKLKKESLEEQLLERMREIGQDPAVLGSQ